MPNNYTIRIVRGELAFEKTPSTDRIEIFLAGVTRTQVAPSLTRRIAEWIERREQPREDTSTEEPS